MDRLRVLAVLLTLAVSADACSRLDPCQNFKCPENGTKCRSIIDACDKPSCNLIPMCTDPCTFTKCSAGNVCVRHSTGQCTKKVCPINSACRPTTKPGKCPKKYPSTIDPTSDMPQNHPDCTTFCNGDHLCPGTQKCCGNHCMAAV